MELGHISRPSDPGIQRPGDPASWPGDPVLQWTPIVELCCRQTFAMGKRFDCFYRCLAFARFWKVKFWRSFIQCQYFNDDWADFHKNIYLYLGLFFRKPEKLGSHTGSEWWPGDPHVKVDPVTQWPSSMSGQDPLGMEHFRWTAMRLFAELLWTLVRCYTVWKLMLRRRSVCKAESAVRVCDLLPRLCITV